MKTRVGRALARCQKLYMGKIELIPLADGWKATAGKHDGNGATPAEALERLGRILARRNYDERTQK